MTEESNDQHTTPGARSRLVLGTAQLAERYGVASCHSLGTRNSPEDAHAILTEATNLGISALDTAPAYGASEFLIGTSNWPGQVWTKLDPRLSPGASIRQSLHALGRSWIDIVFFHDTNQLLRLSKSELADLCSLKGRVLGELAISVYDVREVVRAFDVLSFAIVQIPVNIFDTRFEDWIQRGELPEGLTYIARSALLQGALSQPRQAVEHLPTRIASALLSWLELCNDLAVPPGEAALTWVLARPFVDSVIVGAEDPLQLRQLVAWSKSDRVCEILEAVHATDLWPLSDPRQW